MHATKLWFKTCLNVGINNNFFLKKNPKLRCFIIIITRKKFFTKFNFNVNDFLKTFHWKKTEQYKKQGHAIYIVSHNSAYFNVICFNTNQKTTERLQLFNTEYIYGNSKHINILYNNLNWKSGNDNYMLWLQTVISCPRIQDTVKSQIGLIFIHIFKSIRNFRQA